MKKIIKQDKVKLISFILFLSLILCLMSPITPFFYKLVGGTDSFVFRYGALAMHNGHIPYHGFFDHKGLLIYIINFIGFIINRNYGVWLIEFIFMFFSIYYTHKIIDLLKIKKSLKYTIIILIFSFLGVTFERGNLVEEYALLPTLISQYIFLKYYIINKIKNREIITNGICLCIVALLRVNMIALWIVNIIYILISKLRNKEIKELLKYIIMFSIGMLIVAIPCTIYLIKNNAFLHFIDNYLIYNFQYSDVTISEKFNAFKLFFSNSTIYISILISVYMLKENEKNKKILIINLIGLLINLFMMSMSGREYMHYGMTIIPFIILPYCLLSKCSFTSNIKLCLNIIICTLILIPNIFEVTSNIFENIDYDNKERMEIVKTINKNTNSNDTISIYGNANYIYYMSNKLSASYYTYQTPIVYVNEDILDDYLKDIKKKKPKIVVVLKEDENRGTIIKKLKKWGYKKIE